MRLALIPALASVVGVGLSAGHLRASENDSYAGPAVPRALMTVSNHTSFGESLGYRVDYRRRFSLRPLSMPGFHTEWTFASLGYSIQSRDSGDLITLNAGMRLGMMHRPYDWLEVFTGLGPEGYLYVYYPTTIDEKFNFYTMKSWGLRFELGSRFNFGEFFGGFGYAAHWPAGGEPGPVDFFLRINWPDNVLQLDRERLEHDTFESNFGEIERVKGRLHHESMIFIGFYF